jgi:hypothetical protein
MKISKTGVSLTKMRTTLGGPDGADEYRNFPARVTTLYRALALDSRALVTTAVEASVRHPGEPLHHLQDRLRTALKENAAAQERLRQILWRLAEVTLTAPVPAMPATVREVAVLDQTLAPAGQRGRPTTRRTRASNVHQPPSPRDRAPADGTAHVLKPEPAAG